MRPFDDHKLDVEPLVRPKGRFSAEMVLGGSCSCGQWAEAYVSRYAVFHNWADHVLAEIRRLDRGAPEV